MPSRPDLRDIASNVREAFADADRETLLDVLTFVLKEYVVEGPPPMLIHQAETLSDLKDLSFAGLISALQTRFEHAELAMFVVDNQNVGVRVGGVVQPLVASRAPLGTATELPRPSAGVHVVEVAAAPRPPQPVAAPAAAPAAAAPPVRGLQMRGRPVGASMGDAPAPRAPTPTPPPAAPAAPGPSGSAPAAATPQPGAPEKEAGSGDDASARFSLLELD